MEALEWQCHEVREPRWRPASLMGLCGGLGSPGRKFGLVRRADHKNWGCHIPSQLTQQPLEVRVFLGSQDIALFLKCSKCSKL